MANTTGTDPAIPAECSAKAVVSDTVVRSVRKEAARLVASSTDTKPVVRVAWPDKALQRARAASALG
jgi:hypothetical protein